MELFGIVGFLAKHQANQMDRIKKGMYQTLASAIEGGSGLPPNCIVPQSTRWPALDCKTQAAEAIAIGKQALTIVCAAYIVAAVMRTYLNVPSRCGDAHLRSRRHTLNL